MNIVAVIVGIVATVGFLLAALAAYALIVAILVLFA